MPTLKKHKEFCKIDDAHFDRWHRPTLSQVKTSVPLKIDILQESR